MAGSTTTGWYHLSEGTESGGPVGPLTWEQLRALAFSGSLGPGDMVWHETMPQWTPAAQVEGLFAATIPPAYHQPQKGSWMLGLIIALIALVITGAGLGVYFGFFYDKDGGGTVVDVTTSDLEEDGGSTVVDLAATDLEGDWEGVFIYRFLDAEGASGAERELADKALNKKLPLLMEVTVYENGEGTIDMDIDMTPVDERIGSTYETLEFTYADGKLAVRGTEPGAKASGTLTQKGDKLIWKGSLEFKDEGTTAKAEYSVQKVD